MCRGAGISEFGRAALLQCDRCSLVFDRGVRQEGADAKREAEWFGDGYVGGSSSWVKVFETWNNRRTWSRIAHFVRQGDRLLEIGIGSGSFLTYARRQGLEVYGCDLSGAICKDVSRRLNIPVFNASVADLPNEITYQAVVMNHVLEHVSDPVDLLERVRARMEPNGVIHIAVPNVRCWEAALSSWGSYEPYHLIYFTPKTLREAAVKANLKIVRVVTHESFSGWFLAVFRMAFGTSRTDAGKRQAMRKARMTTWVEHPYRIAMVVSGALALPLRYVQAKLGFGDEAVLLAQKAE